MSDTPRTDRLQKFTPVGTIWLNHAKDLEREIKTAHSTGFRAGIEEAARVCDRLISGDGICAADGVWIHDCAAAIRAIKVLK